MNNAQNGNNKLENDDNGVKEEDEGPTWTLVGPLATWEPPEKSYYSESRKRGRMRSKQTYGDLPPVRPHRRESSAMSSAGGYKQGRDGDWRWIYLDALRRHGRPTKAAEQVGVGIGAVQRHRKKHPNFQKHYAEAMEEGKARMLEVAMEIGHDERNVDMLKFLLRGFYPEIFGNRMKDPGHEVNAMIADHLVEIKELLRRHGAPESALEGPDGRVDFRALPIEVLNRIAEGK